MPVGVGGSCVLYCPAALRQCAARPHHRAARTMRLRAETDSGTPTRDPLPWEEAIKMGGEGALVKGKVEVANRGGVIVRLSATLTGFLPVSQLDPSRIPAREAGAAPETSLAALVGQELECTILELNAEKSSVVLSEKAALAAAELAGLAAGDVRSGRVKKLADYGAFVELEGADGRVHGLEGLVHISELSWSRVRHPSDVLAPGQAVRVQVLSVEPGRIALSLRRLQADPLLETLDTILPAAVQAGSAVDVVEEPLPGLAAIAEALRAAPGVEAVVLGRQAREQRVVSQDLELWMTNDKVTDGYQLVARAGRQVQELHLRCGLDRDAVKRLILDVIAASRLAEKAQ